jgi:hypothetical protein
MRKEDEDKIERTVTQLLNVINDNDIQAKDLPYTLSFFLYSIGHSLLEDPPETNEEVLLKYAENPTLGSALMAQAVFMKETWSQKEEKKKNDKRIQGKTKRRKVATTI